jgi:putative ABC transport system permease protein
LAVLAGIGAAFGATNTFYASVQARTREIGTLRAIGFPRRDILIAFLAEAILVAFSGFAVGGAVAWALGIAVSRMLGGIAFGAATFSTNVVQLRVGVFDLGVGIVLALAIGLLGGFLPAARAARLRPMEALRRA